MPKVSIILPIYNVAKYLPKCMQSLQNQTLQDMEFICVNDGSPDNSLDILKEYALHDSRIKIIDQPNSGPGKARNTGIEAATGEYTGFVDPDDWVDETMFEKMYNAAVTHDADVVECAIMTHEEKNKKTHLRQKLYPEEIANLSDTAVKADYIFRGVSAAWNKLCRTSLLKEKNIRFSAGHCAEDTIFTLGIKLFADKLIYLDEPLYHYLHRQSSLTHNKSKNNLEVPVFLGDAFALLKQENFYENIKDSFDKLAASLAAQHYRKLPQENMNEYIELCRKYFSAGAFALFDKYSLKPRFWNKLFSVHFNGKVWNFTIFGIKMKFRYLFWR